MCDCVFCIVTVPLSTTSWPSWKNHSALWFSNVDVFAHTLSHTWLWRCVRQCCSREQILFHVNHPHLVWGTRLNNSWLSTLLTLNPAPASILMDESLLTLCWDGQQWVMHVQGEWVSSWTCCSWWVFLITVWMCETGFCWSGVIERDEGEGRGGWREVQV